VTGGWFVGEETVKALGGTRAPEDAVFPLAVEPGVILSLMIKESTFCTLVIHGGLMTFVSGVCEEMALFALFDGLGLSWDVEGYRFAEEEVSGL
jgi:hypothetical protein